jgi:hypothetical protein
VRRGGTDDRDWGWSAEGVPRFLCFDTVREHDILVIQQVAMSAYDGLLECLPQFSLKTALIIAMKTVRC